MENSRDEPSGAAEHPGAVLGMGFGLLAIVGMFLGLAFARGGGDLDVAEELADLLGGKNQLEGFRLESGQRLPGGEISMHFVLEAAASPDGSRGPSEVYLVRFRSAAALTQAFQGLPAAQKMGAPAEDPGQVFAKWEEDHSFAAHIPASQGTIQWDRWQAPQVTERALFEGGGWREAVRVNMGRKDSWLLVVGLWPQEKEADADQMVAVLRQLSLAAFSVE